HVRNPGVTGSVSIRYGTGLGDLLLMKFGPHVELPRTRTVASNVERDEVAICNAATLAALKAALSPRTKGALPTFNALAEKYDDVPTDKEVDAIHQHFVDINVAIGASDF